MKVNLDVVKRAIIDAMRLPDTGNVLLERALKEYADLVAHPNPYYRLFWLLAQRMEPKVIVELGSYRGNAAAAFAIGNPDATVVTIDIHREDEDAQVRCMSWAANLLNFTYINKWTWYAAGDVERICGPIDILYIDAWHEYEHATREWCEFCPLLAPEALVICDDIMDAPGATIDMIKYWDEISWKQEKFLDADMHSGIPMGFMRYLRDVDTD